MGLGWLKKPVGDWISISARVERVPTRPTRSITLGDLPESCTTAPHARDRAWSDWC